MRLKYLPVFELSSTHLYSNKVCQSSKMRHPKHSASFISDIFFCWLIPLFFYGKNHDIKKNDLYEVLPENRSEQLGNRLEKLWTNELLNARKNNKKPSLLKCIIIDYGWSFSIYAIHIGVSILGARIVSPLALGLLISYFTGKTNSKPEAYLHASILVGCMFMSAILNKTHFRGMQNLGMNIRIACSSVIFRKMMRLSHSSLNKISAEKVINLLSNDVVKFEKALAYLHFTWCIPIQVLLIGYIMWLNIGVAALAGVFCIVFLSIPMQVFCGRLMERLRRKVGGRTDRRVMLIGEIINGINVIKMYGWEKPFEKIIKLARKYEIEVIASIFYIKSVLASLFAYAQRLSLFVAILVYVAQGNEVSAATIYTYVQLLGFLHFSINFLFFRAINLGSQAYASVRRIQEFLLMEELKNDITLGNWNPENNLMIKVENLSASWTGNHNLTCLTAINLSIVTGKLYAVTGLVGAGKSSFLKSLFAEITPLTGRISMAGDVSYSTQDPWLWPESIKSNILFGAQYNQERYNKVVRACALLDDFLQLPNGDKTIVGENGVTLSGGQCARINLARAVYRDTNIYLLDDPFSAVDTKISNYLLESCIKDLLKNKTVIFVTHKVQFLEAADEVILIDQGCVKFKGTYMVLKQNAVYQYLIANDNVDTTLENKKDSFNTHPNTSMKEVEDLNDETEALLGKEINGVADIIMNSAETKSTHNKKIPMHLCWIYLRFGNSSVIILVTIAIFTMAQLLCNGCDYWLAYWITSEETYHNGLKSNESSEYIDSLLGLIIFGGFIMGIIFTSIIRAVLLYRICINSNKSIHDKMVSSLLETFIHFFHSNDSGRILNRFTSDVGLVDEVLPETMFHAFETLFHVLGLIIQSIIIEWKTAVLFFSMIYLTMKLRLFTLKTVRALKKIESKAKSPIFSHVKSTFAGITTIRSFKAQSMVRRQFDLHQDNHTAAFFIKDMGLLAYGLWANLIYVGFVSAIPYVFLIFDEEKLSGANAGLIITQVLFMVGAIQYGLTLLSEVSMHMISVQRLLQYTQLDEEKSPVAQLKLKNWPSEGKIKFDHLYLTYPGSDQPVLKDICFSTDAEMKVGIVGRTGAGKSSLISALLGLAKIDGVLHIDEVDTKRVNVHELRQNISVLPQTPILFSISLRENIDPYRKFDDASLWSTLREVELEKLFSSLDQELDCNNLSTGQRQLLCLARAILKKNKIFVLDEPTANVDDVTDSLIQKTIRSKFKNCTVLTIAHRLNTVLDSDKILVMDQGKVVEFDHPYVLLQEKDGFFSRMVESTGDVMSNHLKNVAEVTFKKKNTLANSKKTSQT